MNKFEFSTHFRCYWKLCRVVLVGCHRTSQKSKKKTTDANVLMSIFTAMKAVRKFLKCVCSQPYVSIAILQPNNSRCNIRWILKAIYWKQYSGIVFIISYVMCLFSWFCHSHKRNCFYHFMYVCAGALLEKF